MVHYEDVTLCQIRYSQDSIARRFQSGQSIYKTNYSIDNYPELDCVRYNGDIYTLNNRTLFAMKNDLNQYYDTVTVRIVKKPRDWEICSLTAWGNGTDIDVR